MQGEIAQQDRAERQLSREELQALNNKRAGLFIFQISWIMVFVCLIVVNWQLRYEYPTWPPPGVVALGRLLPTLATGLLLLSSFLARSASHAVEAGHREAFLTWWRLAIALGVAFIAIMSYEWAIAPMGTQYGSVFRLMTGFHGTHALVIGLFMVYVLRRGHQYGPNDFWPVEAAAKLWYFVTVAWILFYLVLYWI